MIKTTAIILDELRQYSSPADKLTRLLRQGEYIQITKGLYETDKATPGYLLAGSIYGPSYLSFEFALGYYGMIPETVYTFTSATFGKRKKKVFENIGPWRRIPFVIKGSCSPFYTYEKENYRG